MSQINNKDYAIINPKKGKHDPELSHDILIILTHNEIRTLASMTDARLLSHSEKAYYNIFEFDYNGKGPIHAIGPFIGAPHAVLGLEKAIVCGGKRFWVTGYCGSLQPELRIGDFIVPEMAYPEEGTSAHYPLKKNNLTPDINMKNSITDALKRTNHNFRCGPIWTTDAPYRETAKKIMHYQEMGVLGVEMELSALIKVSMFRGAQLAGLLVVSDELFDLRWRHGFKDKRLKDSAILAIKIILNIITS